MSTTSRSRIHLGLCSLSRAKYTKLRMCIRSFENSRGAVVLEAAVAFPVFLMLVMGIIEFAHLSYTKANLQFALTEACRYMVTGQGMGSPANPALRMTVIENRFCQNLMGTGLPCTNVSAHFTVTCVNPSVCTSPGPVSCAAGCTQPAGGPGQTVTVSVSFTKNWIGRWFARLFPRTSSLSAKSTWKNEPYM